jgi:ABC-type amino acid transport substrate-binding protein
MAFKMVVVTRNDTGIDAYESQKGRRLGSTAGTYEAIALEKDMKAWNDPKSSFRGYSTQADVFLALSQGQIDSTVVTSTVAKAIVAEGKFKNLKIGGDAP